MWIINYITDKMAERTMENHKDKIIKVSLVLLGSSLVGSFIGTHLAIKWNRRR